MAITNIAPNNDDKNYRKCDRPFKTDRRSERKTKAFYLIKVNINLSKNNANRKHVVYCMTHIRRSYGVWNGKGTFIFQSNIC